MFVFHFLLFISFRFVIQLQVLEVEMKGVQGLQGDFEKILEGQRGSSVFM